MTEIKKCKISYKEKNGKVIVQQRGYCDEKNPNKILNRDIEIDFDSAMKAMDKTFKNLPEPFND